MCFEGLIPRRSFQGEVDPQIYILKTTSLIQFHVAVGRSA
jgi:hypothetical protein